MSVELKGLPLTRSKNKDRTSVGSVRKILPAVRTIVAAILVWVTFPAGGTPAWSADRRPRNQASAADTLILPADGDETASDSAFLIKGMRAVGLDRLDHVGIIDAKVDADGCMSAPLAVSHSPEGTHSEGLEAVADALRRRGVTVTIIPPQEVLAIDLADQNRVRAMKGSLHLAFGNGEGRWFATKADMITCTRVGNDEAESSRTVHAPLATIMAALQQDVVLALGESQSGSKGADWNVIEGALSSSGNSLDAGTAQATVSATLVLKNGMTPWSGDAHARGALRPPLDRQSVVKLKTYMEGELQKMAAFRNAHPGAKEPVDRRYEQTFNSIASGNLDEAPEGTSIGPSAHATLQAAADRLVDQLQPILPKK